MLFVPTFKVVVLCGCLFLDFTLCPIVVLMRVVFEYVNVCKYVHVCTHAFLMGVSQMRK